MRIHPIDTQLMVKKYEGVRKTEAVSSFSLQGADDVELSDVALIYANATKELRASLHDTSSSDAIKIRNLSLQIQNGTYQVDTSKIVDKMLEGV